MVIVAERIPGCEEIPAYPSSRERRGNIGCNFESGEASEHSANHPWARFYGRRVIKETYGKEALEKFEAELSAERDGSVAQTMGEEFSIRGLSASTLPLDIPTDLEELDDWGHTMPELDLRRLETLKPVTAASFELGKVA